MFNYSNLWLIAVLFCLITIPNNIFTNSKIMIDETHRQDVIDYVNEIKSNIDVKVDPCDNFLEYACGNITPETNPLKLWDMSTIFTKYFNLTQNNESKAEKLVRDLYFNCQEVNENPKNYTTIIKKIFEQIDILSSFKTFPVPVKQLDLNSSHFAELESHLLAIGTGTLIQMNSYYGEVVFFLAPSDPKNIGKLIVLLEYLRNNNISITTEEDEIAIQDILKFVNDYKNLFNKPIEEFKQNDSNDTYALNELKDVLPSENINWETINKAFSKILNLDTTNTQYKFRIMGVDFFKNLIKLVDNTDIKTLINFEILKYVQIFGDNMECKTFRSIAKYVLLKKIWIENLSSQRTVERYTKFINDFESSLNITLKNIPDDYDDSSVENIKRIQFILENYTKLLNDNNMNDISKNSEEGKFYKISILLQQNVVKAMLDYNSGKDMSTFNLISGNYDNDIELNSKNKPYLYFYNVINFKLWYAHFALYQYHGKNSEDQFYECLKQFKWINAFTWVPYVTFISTYTTIKRILNDYDTNDLLKGELSIANELMDTRKLFFTSIIQNFCKESKKYYNVYEVRVLPHLKEFTDAFKCPEETKINKISKNIRCDFSTCPNDYEYLKEFLPYKINQC